MRTFVIRTIFMMKFLLLFFITVAIVTNGTEGLKCYVTEREWQAPSQFYRYKNRTAITSIDQAEVKDCEEGFACFKEIDSE